MEDLYRLNGVPTASYSDDLLMRAGKFSPGNYTNTAASGEFHTPCVDSMLQFNNETTAGSDISDDLIIKAQITNHPLYQNLVSAYINCRKVGATRETASILEEINQENKTTRNCSGEIGADPELDEFMGSYCEVLHRYKEELSKPFDEATTFLNNIESQLSNLCKGDLPRTLDYPSDEAAGTSDEELSYEEIEPPGCQDSLNGRGHSAAENQDVKEMLMRKYSGCLSSLKKEFSKKKKKGKLPKDARTTLMGWWNKHCKWPYPTGDEKLKLSEETGLDQKQINNWFINQRKRHWKPTEDMGFALLEGSRQSGNCNINEEPIYFIH